MCKKECSVTAEKLANLNIYKIGQRLDRKMPFLAFNSAFALLSRGKK
jgi:hypothetical protein